MSGSSELFADASIAATESRADLAQRREFANFIERRQSELALEMYKAHFDKEWIGEWKIGVPNHSQDFFIDKFLKPLLRLLSAALRAKDDSLLCVYLDERLRFAPHRAEWSRRAEFHSRLLAKDLQTIVRLYKTGPLRLPDMERLWADVHRPLLSQVDNRGHLGVLGVGDCLLNELRVFLPARARRQGLALDMRCAYFSASVAGGLDASEILDLLSTTKIDLVAFSFFSYEGLPQYVHLMRQCDGLKREQIDGGITLLVHTVRAFLTNLRERTQIPFLLHTVSGLPLRRWRKYIPLMAPLSRPQRYIVQELNSKLMELAGALENCLIVDEEAAVRKHGGLRKCSREVAPQRQFGGLFHTSKFGEYLSTIYLQYAAAYFRLRKTKVLCIDFDNTLWRGVMADGQVEHWFERQKLLLRLKDAGMLLVALSKNAEENIRWQEMSLRKEDFVVRKINWNTKAQSLREVQGLLNLGIDSFVIVDDSIQERALMSKEIPEVACLDGADEFTWKQLEWLLDFPNTQQTEEARSRTRLYQEQADRQGVMNSAVDYQGMMTSLELWYRFGEAKKAQIDRIAELIARTNQFNTTTIRYTKEELFELMKNTKAHLFAGELGDRFGSMGLTIVVILREQEEGTSLNIVVDSLVMSCRAMGFGFEDQALNKIKEFSRKRGAERITGRYIQTDRNSPCEKVFSRNGFEASGETDFFWETGGATEISAIPWLTERA